MKEWEPVLMGEGEKTTTLRDISSPSHVVWGSQAVMNRGKMQRQALGGQGRGLKKGRPDCGAFSLFLFEGV